MRLNRLETHDRFVHFTKQDFDIGKTIQSIVDKEPFGKRSFYIFAHKREIGLDERISIFNQDLMSGNRQFLGVDDVPSARIIWQPRLTKPLAQENSMLFKVHSGSDLVKVIWMIPQRELWNQYEKNKMTENQTVFESIRDFKYNRSKLEAPEKDDPTDDECSRIYQEIYGDKHVKI